MCDIVISKTTLSLIYSIILLAVVANEFPEGGRLEYKELTLVICKTPAGKEIPVGCEQRHLL